MAAPETGRGLVDQELSGPRSGMPLVVAPPRPGTFQLFADGGALLDFAPLRLTLSDGGVWRRGPWPPRWDVTLGAVLGRCAAAAIVGPASVGLAGQVDVLRVGGHRLGITGAARVTALGPDGSLVPSWAFPTLEGRLGALVPFAALRARAGRTVYDVRGWDDARATPFAHVAAWDVALAPMAGVAAVWRFAELRVTAGYEALLVDRLDEEDRPTDLSRSGGAFLLVALRGILPLRTAP